jgi:NAD(P) transhydrogenase subunit alpha
MEGVETQLVVGVLRETAAGERRVAITPDGVTRLQALGLTVVVEHGAGEGASFRDGDYVVAGASVTSREDLLGHADLVVCVRAPGRATTDRIGEGGLLLGMLGPELDHELATVLAEAKVTTITFDRLPRTLPRAQSLDALTSQANVAGYKAVLVAADTYSGFFPMLMTAAGTTRPAAVLVLGAGVAGLQAIATARRLGAQVTGYDVRDAAKGDVLSLGATFLELGGISAAGAGGYARALTAEETLAQQEAMAEAVSRFDVVITTAQVPGRKPPVLIPRDALERLGAGSVVVDLAAGPFGGNVEGSVADSTIVTDRGVTVVGAGNLPAQVPRAASSAYSRNTTALLAMIVRDGALHIDLQDEVQAGVVVTHAGAVLRPELFSPGGGR